KLFYESTRTLHALRGRNPTCTEPYLKAQWNHQRQCQLQAMVNENSRTLAAKLTKLGGLEERHIQIELKELRAVRSKPRRNQTASDRCRLVLLPETLQLLEEEINGLVEELGGDHYRDMPGPRSKLFLLPPKGKMLIRIRVAKSKLYQARVDVFEMQRRNDEREGESL
ncbi:hypothetical protein DFH28DRAFT_871968, partial [Melampsora americana]